MPIMTDVFVSYSQRDTKLAQEMIARLAMNGMKVWWDQNQDPTHGFSEQITEQLRRSKAVLVLWTENSRASDWVKAEAGYGYVERKLVQVCAKGAQPPQPFPRNTYYNFDGDSEPILRALDTLQVVRRKWNYHSRPSLDQHEFASNITAFDQADDDMVLSERSGKIWRIGTEPFELQRDCFDLSTFSHSRSFAVAANIKNDLVVIGLSDGRLAVTNGDLEFRSLVGADIHKASITSLGWAASGRLLFCGGKDKKISRWELSQTNEPIQLAGVQTTSASVQCLVNDYVQDEVYIGLSSGNLGRLSMSGSAPDQDWMLRRPVAITAIALHPTRDVIAVGTSSRKIFIVGLDREDLRNKKSIIKTIDPIVDTYVYVPHNPEWVRVLTPGGRYGKWLASDGHSQQKVLDLAFSPDGTILAAGTSCNGLMIWETQGWTRVIESQKLASTLTTNARVSHVRFSKNGQSLYTAGGRVVSRLQFRNRSAT